MTNIAYKDRAGGPIRVYTANAELPKQQRIILALEELKPVGNINIYLYKRGKLRLIKRKAF